MTRYQARRWVLLILALACFTCAGLMLLALLEQPAGGVVSPIVPSPSARVAELPAPTATAGVSGEVTVTLPVVWREFSVTPPPITGTMIYDCDGNITDTIWLHDYFGDVQVTGPVTATAQLAALRAACYDAPAVLVAHVTYGGMPLEGVTFVLHYPGAPMLPLELRDCGLDRGVYGPTNANGDIGFGLGQGSYYEPPDGGPHTMWIGDVGGSVCLSGLGMIRFTAHHHLDSSWALDAGDVAALKDWGYSPGVAVYPMSHNGATMWVIQGP